MDTNIIFLPIIACLQFIVRIVVWCDLGLIVNAIPRPKNKVPVVPVSRPTLLFLPTLLFFSTRLTVRLYFLRVVAGCSYSVPKWCLLSQKLPKFVRRNYASLVNIDVGTLVKIAQQKTAKTIPTLIFSRYETGTTGISLGPMRKTTLYVAEVRLLEPSVNPL